MKIVIQQDEQGERIKRYPSVAKQLDAIWDILFDKDNNLDLTKGGNVVDRIKLIRAQIKKRA